IREALLDGFQEEARRRPTVVIADDVQWFDAASVGSLARIAELVREHALSLIVATRPSARSARTERLLGDLIRDGATTIELEGLPVRDVVQLAEALVESPIGPRLARNLAVLRGSPMLALEVVAALRSEQALQRLADGRTELARGERIGALADASHAIAQ